MKAILNGIHHLLEQAGNLVVVTNEVFSDGITYDPETEISGKTWCDQLSDGADRRYSHRGCLRNSDFHKKTGEERKNEEILS